jgi:hypothetical protein
MHQLLAHDPSVHPAFLTSKFIDGLKLEIKAAIVLHRPKDLDTSSSLAILQEEVIFGNSSKEYKRLEPHGQAKFTPRQTQYSPAKLSDNK